jgi:hypothetical protein
MCTAVLIGWDLATPPPAFGLVYEGGIGQQRRHLFGTPLVGPLYQLLLWSADAWEEKICCSFSVSSFLHGQALGPYLPSTLVHSTAILARFVLFTVLKNICIHAETSVGDSNSFSAYPGEVFCWMRIRIWVEAHPRSRILSSKLTTKVLNDCSY